MQSNDLSGVEPDRREATRPRAAARVGRTLVLSGELDLATRPALIAAAHELVEHCGDSRDSARQDEHRAVDAFVDTESVDYIDASSVSVLVDLHNSLAAIGIGLQTIGPCRSLRRISSICGLDVILGLEPTAEGPRPTRSRNSERPS